MGKRYEDADKPDTPLDPVIANGEGVLKGENLPEQDLEDDPEKTKEEIVIKQVPVDGICGGY